MLALLLCYGLYFVATFFAHLFGLPLTAFILAVVIALHSSLQHEVLHGHPFPNQKLSEMLVFPALGLFIPYERFRDTHLAHHKNTKLTDPYDDPESNYLDPAQWARYGPIRKKLLRFNNMLAGRMLAGPLLGLLVFWRGDIALMWRGDKAVIRAYIMHGLGLLPVGLWVVYMSAMPLWLYILAAYFGLSLLKLRTFLEHRAHEVVPGRTVIIEDKGFFSYLFLNNNYHSVHHAHPKLAWYLIPQYYEQRKALFLKHNRGYVYRSYWEIFSKYFFRVKDPVPHPLMPDNLADDGRSREKH